MPYKITLYMEVIGVMANYVFVFKLTYGVMVTQLVLVQSFEVRILIGQRCRLMVTMWPLQLKKGSWRSWWKRKHHKRGP